MLHLLVQKIHHVLLFAVFGWLLALPAVGSSPQVCLTWAVTAGISAEELQILVPARHLVDALLNLITCIGSIAFVGRVSRRDFRL